MPGHQGPHPARVCAIGPAAPAAHHRSDEREPGAQHHLLQLLEGEGKQLRCASLLRETLPPAVVHGGAE